MCEIAGRGRDPGGLVPDRPRHLRLLPAADQVRRPPAVSVDQAERGGRGVPLQPRGGDIQPHEHISGECIFCIGVSFAVAAVIFVVIIVFY